MNKELTLALKIVQDAGYKVTEPAKDPDKFIPVNGQIGYAGKNKNYLRVFDHIKDGKYMCKRDDNRMGFVGCDYFEPIPGLIQMEPYDPSYEDKANVLFEDGSIFRMNYSTQANLDELKDAYGKPIFFQKLGE